MIGKLFTFLSFFVGGALCASPPDSLAVQEMRLSLESMGHKLHSQSVELTLSQERLQNLETGLQELKRELKAAHLEKTLEKRVAALEKANETLIADFKTLKTHLNETSTTLAQCQTHLNKIDKQLSSDIQTLKSSLHSMLALMQPSSGDAHTYIVKSGDSLGQIAMDHKTDIKTLKKLNNLSSDVIYSGQKLLLP